MTAGQYRHGSSWTARFAWGALLLLVGAALATWGLSRWDAGARFLGIGPRQPLQIVRQPSAPAQPAVQAAETLTAAYTCMYSPPDRSSGASR